MSYTINLTNGTTLIPGGLSDGTIDTSHTPLVLIGKNYAGYGQFMNENFVKMLENFAYSSSPANALVGQLWWDTTNNVMRVWTGTSWKISTGATSSPASSPPGDLSALGGDLWFDSTNNQLKVYSGSQWITIGPAATTSTGDSGTFPALITDTAGAVHTIVQFRIRSIVYAIFAYENFTTVTPGFTNIVAGINWNDTGIAYDSVKAGSLTLANSTAATTTTSGALQVSGGAGIAGNLYVGGNLYVTGNLTIGSNVNIISANNLSVIDNMIYLNSNSTLYTTFKQFQLKVIIQSNDSSKVPLLNDLTALALQL